MLNSSEIARFFSSYVLFAGVINLSLHSNAIPLYRFNRFLQERQLLLSPQEEKLFWATVMEVLM